MHRRVVLQPRMSFGLAILLLLGAGPVLVQAQDKLQAASLCEAAGITGGLCVAIGSADAQSAADLARNGQYLVHVLDWDTSVIDSLRSRLQEMGLYGLASVELLGDGGKLPYTENLVNAVILGGKAIGRIPLVEVARVLHPEGVLLVADKQIWEPLPGFRVPN